MVCTTRLVSSQVAQVYEEEINFRQLLLKIKSELNRHTRLIYVLFERVSNTAS